MDELVDNLCEVLKGYLRDPLRAAEVRFLLVGFAQTLEARAEARAYRDIGEKLRDIRVKSEVKVAQSEE